VFAAPASAWIGISSHTRCSTSTMSQKQRRGRRGARKCDPSSSVVLPRWGAVRREFRSMTCQAIAPGQCARLRAPAARWGTRCTRPCAPPAAAALEPRPANSPVALEDDSHEYHRLLRVAILHCAIGRDAHLALSVRATAQEWQLCV
jgi:hypothetical protein